ncbi:MAG: N-acyl homoserine lactonase family protein [Burkholderiales bacterium]|nr:N-acyl homoserine lactonase family protein [Burkholderiales bacterium]
MTLPTYQVYAIRYAHRAGRRAEHFVGGDAHDAPMPMDYFVWLVRNRDRTIVVDTGFGAAVAARRGREFLRSARQGFELLGVRAGDIGDVVVTHMHNDHAGTLGEFAQARFHVQDAEMAYVTGRHMGRALLRRPYELDDVMQMIRLTYAGRVAFHAGDEEIAPGVSVHHVGGHTPGLQSVRVHTARGWVVLASDASHYYEHFEAGRVFPVTVDLATVLEGYDKLLRLAESRRHIIPGHDPQVMQRYPAVAPGLDGIAVRLDVEPIAAS